MRTALFLTAVALMPLAIAGSADLAPSNRDRVPEVAERAVQSVVRIAITQSANGAEGDVERLRQMFGLPEGMRMPERQGEGSGVVVDADGIVLTNHHVVAGADRILVGLADGRSLEAEVLGTDPKSDLAVLRLTDPPDDLVPLTWGDADRLRLGESVLAVGNPFGMGHTVTLGIVSAKGRAGLGIVEYEDFIQTDAAINPGNSGGALVDMDGRLVGINTAILSRSGGSQGIGLAISESMAQKVVAELLEDGEVARGWLGVAIADLDTDQELEIGRDGVRVEDVVADSPADDAGLMPGDVIVALNDAPMGSVQALRMTVADEDPGEDFRLEVFRDGHTQKLRGTLERRPE